MTRPQKSEQRRHPRVAKRLAITLGTPGLTFEAATHNISSSGLYCDVPAAIPLMTKVDVTLLLPTNSAPSRSYRQIRCGGVVVRHDTVPAQRGGALRHRLAIFFTRMQPRDRHNLTQFVEHQLGASPP